MKLTVIGAFFLTAGVFLKKQTPENEEGGLKFMALMLNVEDKQLDLEVKKEVTQMESLLLRVIRRGTVGALNDQKQILNKVEFYIEDLSNRLGYKERDKIWKLLKSLEKKNLITRQKTRSKNREIIGLNHEVFGQILIDKFYLKVVVDNSKKEPTDRRSITDEPSVISHQTVGSSPTNRRLTDSQEPEIIDKKTLLDSSRLIKTFLDGKTEGKKEINFSETEGGIIDRNLEKFRVQKKLMGL